MTSPAPAFAERPTRPVAGKPAGYVGLATYSSLGRLWQLLAGAQRAGRQAGFLRPLACGGLRGAFTGPNRAARQIPEVEAVTGDDKQLPVADAQDPGTQGEYGSVY